MNNFINLSHNELNTIDGGVYEIYIAGKVFTGIAAGAITGGAGLALVGVAALGWYVMSKN